MEKFPWLWYGYHVIDTVSPNFFDIYCEFCFPYKSSVVFQQQQNDTFNYTKHAC